VRLFVVVAYDISDDRRRDRISKELKNYGVRVQYSVFECLLDWKRLKEMEKRVVRHMKLDEDSLRIYILRKGCEKEIIIHGTSKLIDEEEVYIL